MARSRTVHTPSSDYAARWGIFIAVGLAAAVSCLLMGSSIDVASALPDASLLIVLFALAVLCPKLLLLAPRLRRPMAVIEDLCLSVTQIWVLGMIFALLIYIAALSGAGVPFQDDRLARSDSLLGFDWDATARWVSGHRVLERLLRRAYLSATTGRGSAGAVG